MQRLTAFSNVRGGFKNLIARKYRQKSMSSFLSSSAVLKIMSALPMLTGWPFA
ncbi:hypothetical protein D3C87_2016530 [compost metagenome]